MSTDSRPERAAKRGGEEIARLRTSRGWTRAKLVSRLYEEIEANDPNFDSISESWLARLEDGRMVKVRRQTLEALCRALNCSHRERTGVLLAADRNTLTEDGVSDPAAVVLNYVMVQVHAEAKEILTDLIGQRRALDLDDQELLEITATALSIVLKRHRRCR